MALANLIFRDHLNETMNAQMEMVDTRRPSPWNASQHEPEATGCLKMFDSGVFDIKVRSDSYG